ncbi:MAG TPA: ABC transporter permease [Solirubrobacteraceae bacterium]|nr:ABC transporter permease [Solirubrobacteraceae bacterium]
MATTTSETGTQFSTDLPAALAQEEVAAGTGPWRLAWRRLRRNKTALFFGGLFIVIVVLCLLAPVYARDIAHIGPATENITGSNLNKCPPTCVGPTDIPVGPSWNISSYFLGADSLGRDVAVRLLYGGRNSLEIGAVATIITMILAMILGVAAGFLGGVADNLINLILDVTWAFPVVLLGIVLGTLIATSGIGPLHSTTLMSTALIIGVVYFPYVAKPIRAQVLSLRQREFVDAARQQGLGNVRIMFSEILPNLASTIVVFIPLILANAILLEAALTYLGAGVQPPNASWGTMLSDGISTIPAAFHDVLAPGIMLVLTVLSINIFGDGLRDALDPRSKVRIAH